MRFGIGAKKQHLTLSDADRSTFETLLSKGKLSTRTFKFATVLLALGHGKALQQIAATLDRPYTMVANWRDGYKVRHLTCLNDAPHSRHPSVIDGTQRAKITALTCNDAAEGHARCFLRLRAEKRLKLACVTMSCTLLLTTL